LTASGDDIGGRVDPRRRAATPNSNCKRVKRHARARGIFLFVGLQGLDFYS
jgi:hypothetical protein